MFEANISSTRHIARFWGLLGLERAPSKPSVEAARPAPGPPVASGVTATIENALRKAGLMR
jgi:hypothetical protein